MEHFAVRRTRRAFLHVDLRRAFEYRKGTITAAKLKASSSSFDYSLLSGSATSAGAIAVGCLVKPFSPGVVSSRSRWMFTGLVR